MRTKKTLLTALTLVLLMTAMPLFARGNGGKGKNTDRRGDLKKELGLSDSQVKKIDKIRIKTRREVMDLHHSIKQTKLTMQEDALDGKITKKNLKKVLSNMKTTQDKIHNLKFNSNLSILDILTNEQIAQMAEKKMFGKILHFIDGGKKGGHKMGNKGNMGNKGGRGKHKNGQRR